MFAKILLLPKAITPGFALVILEAAISPDEKGTRLPSLNTSGVPIGP